MTSKDLQQSALRYSPEDFVLHLTFFVRKSEYPISDIKKVFNVLVF
ncbi:hypothetical protein OP10G_1717 [Fimbriimonas ginsengisoli Gsoil 348]|uniref:Uncharacterized protein n=1 Tax=Fimbriimonas ginsengisoli Gsoil 348 TaxID=661478 RepID=A0A068NQT8_FIMGI|nr:hypothetical protein OP10G_1717 [Fimbriimonas ginsengisoli Gsoil 348]